MKLQHIIIIFVIIIVPISITLSMYINTQIKTINNQTHYSNVLINATYDGIKAFQLNTANNAYSTISNSKIRDIEAAINVYYSSLATNLNSTGYGLEELKGFTPAILFTLYDGYYIHTNHNDVTYKANNDGPATINSSEWKYGLKPFIYYSCRYKKDSNYDFVVNYTLDNTITVIGNVKGQYVEKTGHLIFDEDIVAKEKEILSEDLLILDDDGTHHKEKFQYIVYNSQKIYRDNNRDALGGPKNDTTYEHGAKRYFYYSSEYKKDYVTELTSIAGLNEHLGDDRDQYGRNLYSDSAIKYYNESKEFTGWVKDNLREIKQSDACDEVGRKLSDNDFASGLGETNIFNINSNNNPLDSASAFNEHRMNVIRRSIETNFLSALATFNQHTVVGYEFTMPKLAEDEWGKLENNVCMATFLQGIPIGTKVYNNYCVVSNNTNQETVGNDSIYIIDNAGEYHKPGCKRLMGSNIGISGAYPASEFVRKSISLKGEDSNAHSQLLGQDSGNNAYYYPQSYTPCYDCIVTASETYSTDDIIKNSTLTDNNRNRINIRYDLRKIYLRALARSRYDLYITNGYFGI